MLLSLVRRRAVAFVVALLAALALVFALWPTTAGATASNQVKAPNDAKISQANPDTPSGQDPTIRVSGSSSVGLFKFTTASLSTPAGATINEVFVQMFLDPTSTAVDGDELRLYESTCFTSEDTVTWNTRPTRLDLLATRDVFNQSGTLRPSVTFSYTDLTALNTGTPTCFWVESTNAATTVEVESHENGDTAKQAVVWVDYSTSGTTTTTQPPPGGTKVMAAGDLCDPDVQVPTNNPTCEGPADLVTTYNAERWIPLGDLAYPGDTPDLDNYKAEYDDVKSITIPVEGNHDDDAEFANYFGAQGDASGNQISRTDLGAWSVITAETNGAPTTAERTTSPPSSGLPTRPVTRSSWRCTSRRSPPPAAAATRRTSPTPSSTSTSPTTTAPTWSSPPMITSTSGLAR
jgi:hypothetical protein